MMEVSCRASLRDAEGPFELEAAFGLREGEAVALFGRSGAGKTTLLRIIAGLSRPSSGLVRVGNEVWFDSSRSIDVPPQRRRIGFVFQEPSLFPHLSVRGNLRYALERGADQAVVDELLDMMDLRGLADRRPSTLSGGQKQRVALARALVRRPELLLLDEPLSALDEQARAKVHEELVAARERFRTTTLLVSHDPREVRALSDRVLVIDRGKILSDGQPREPCLSARSGDRLSVDGQLVEVRRDGSRLLGTVAVDGACEAAALRAPARRPGA